MYYPILVIGKPGSGKSASLRNLDPKTTFVISVIGKSLPFKSFRKDYKAITGWEDKKGNFYIADDIIKILKCIEVVNTKRLDIKTLVIDDWQYILSHEFMRRAKEKGYEKFTDLALTGWQSIMSLKGLRKDLASIILAHSELDHYGFARLKTIGKLLSEKVDFEGEFEVCLHARMSDGQYIFQTNQDAEFMARSPMGMFENQFMENDLTVVLDRMNAY